eukprot:CAMPEP_0205926648 /NCGR_PEP_ID=MMETSP1325-20131115/20930_1 /ASSEMBLY_ACC=CAM_ASM_000708 /TAXON_ID=236786 /ORGANISM="Florenciella sp., Strain RCC1007" /LENGTH=149 /DNA_ID=CAMNT_0053295407 /DNA_START=289 /DNA_END=734 /DNA_ORIENTATION=-
MCLDHAREHLRLLLLEEVVQRAIDLDRRLEGVVFARRSRVGGELLLDDDLDLLALVSDLDDLLDQRARTHDGAVLVSKDGITRSHRHTTAGDDIVARPRHHHSRALLGSGRVREHREAVANQFIGVAHRTVGHKASDVPLHETKELDVT